MIMDGYSWSLLKSNIKDDIYDQNETLKLFSLHLIIIFL
jgi:hypothetical protein